MSLTLPRTEAALVANLHSHARSDYDDLQKRIDTRDAAIAALNDAASFETHRLCGNERRAMLAAAASLKTLADRNRSEQAAILDRAS